jgi:site-specific DNA recombinase
VTTALIYLRVSTDEQAREGVSLDAQLAECRRYAARLGWVLGAEYADVLSGTRDDRPRYQARVSRHAWQLPV